MNASYEGVRALGFPMVLITVCLPVTEQYPRLTDMTLPCIASMPYIVFDSYLGLYALVCMNCLQHRVLGQAFAPTAGASGEGRRFGP